ncbi:hypothetical protein [Winogradskya humida]|uniref:Uncharacterized protein n=1 Tax=Winogradskya humida TaxID=113566 RepID=A0ABQ4A270_9ACTN|nr:hypothetical protein [Actinoplanes humidus]GIE24804.1 hypothetical protein Ahu01nite_079060 [Actinoplanes humidus]
MEPKPPHPRPSGLSPTDTQPTTPEVAATSPNSDVERAVLPPGLAGRDPGTTPADEHTIDTVLSWITDAKDHHPALTGWAQYAVTAARRLHGDDHPQTRRATLADAAVQARILPLTPDSPLTLGWAVTNRLRNRRFALADSDDLANHLEVYLALHERGHCDLAITELHRTVSTPLQIYPSTAATTFTAVIIAVAAATACGHNDLAARILDTHAATLHPCGSLGRDVFAGYALTVIDRIRDHHQTYCTRRRATRTYDRHRVSAHLHGEHPDRHTSPTPATTNAGGTGVAAPWVPVIELFYGLDNQETIHHRRLTAANNTQGTALFLICDTCRLALHLGTTAPPGTTQSHDTPHLAPFTDTGQPAWQDPAVSRAVWQLFSDHAGHELRVLGDTSPAMRKYQVTPTDFIGRTAPADDGSTMITLDAYLQHDPDQRPTTSYPGATPQPPHDPAVLFVNDIDLVCVACRLVLDLGAVTGATPAIHIGEHPAHDDITATAAVFRMLTDHIGHDLALYTENGPWDYFTADDLIATVTTGHDRPPLIGEITHQQYTDGWPEKPTHRYYWGADPLNDPPAHHDRTTSARRRPPPNSHPHPNTVPFPQGRPPGRSPNKHQPDPTDRPYSPPPEPVAVTLPDHRERTRRQPSAHQPSQTAVPRRARHSRGTASQTNPTPHEK